MVCHDLFLSICHAVPASRSVLLGMPGLAQDKAGKRREAQKSIYFFSRRWWAFTICGGADVSSKSSRKRPNRRAFQKQGDGNPVYGHGSARRATCRGDAFSRLSLPALRAFVWYCAWHHRDRGAFWIDARLPTGLD